jgi:hypothetical protein
MDEFDLNCSIVRNPEVVYTQLDQDLIMMKPKEGVYYGVNAVGTQIWNFLESGNRSLDEICKHLLNTFDVEEQQCFTEMQQFLKEMIEQKMILVVE